MDIKVSTDLQHHPHTIPANRKKLKERCEKYSVTYIAPSLTDSVQAIKERKSLLHKKFQATADKVRWKNMTVSDRNKRAANKKRQGELVYQQQCKASKTLYNPPPTPNIESASETRARRRKGQ
jgi:hypothetical protein